MLVGFGLCAVEDPVAEVEDGEDDREALARQFVDATGVVLAVVRGRCGGRQGRGQRSGHHGRRLLMLGRRRRSLMVPVMRRRLGGGGGGEDARTVL